MKSWGGARVIFLSLSLAIGVSITTPVEASWGSRLCHRAVTWLRLQRTALLKNYDLDKPLTPVKGIIDAVAVSVERDGKYLLGFRIAPPLKDRWGQLGGKVEPGESLRQAALRELREEAGIDLSDLKFEFLLVTYLEENGNRYRVFVLSTSAFSGEPELKEPEKTAELRWFDPREIPHFLTSATEAYFLRSGLLRSGKNVRP